MEIQNRSQVWFFAVLRLKKSCNFLLGLHLPKNDKKWFLGPLGSVLWHEKKLIIFPTFSICRPNPYAYRPDFSRMKKNLGDMRMDLAGIWKMSRKNLIFFRAQIHFLKLPKLIFYRFWAKISATENSMTFSGQKQQKSTLESSFEFPLSIWLVKKIFSNGNGIVKLIFLAFPPSQLSLTEQ